nr:MAG: hypothetical protein [Bacteriophage sp.]
MKEQKKEPMKEQKKEQMKEQKKEQMKERSSLLRQQIKLECSISSLIGSLNLEFSNVFHRPLSQDLFQKIRLETINYLLSNGVKMTYPTYQQYTFVKIFYETPEEENKALFLMEGIKNIIKKNAEKKQ